jgi:tetratricopeptide (TPR) repeat protein
MRVTIASTCVLILFIATDRALPNSAQPKKRTVQKTNSKAKRDTSAEEQRLRTHLDFAPHDHPAYQQLLKLLKDRYAFRAQALLDAQWLQNNPNDYFALIDLTSCAVAALNDPEFAVAAQRAYLQKVQRDPSDTTYDFTMSSMASQLSVRGRGQEALRLNDQLIEWNPDDGGLWADRAAIQFRMGGMSDALASLRQSVKLDASSEGTHEELGDLFFVSGDPDDAVSEYRAAISLYQAKYNRGEASDSLSDLIGSMVKVERKYQSEHRLAQFYLKQARALIRLGKYDEAIAATSSALAADKGAINALYIRAQVYDAAADSASAQKTRDAVLSSISTIVSKEEMKQSKAFGDPRVAFLLTVDSDSEFAPLDLSAELIHLLDNHPGPLTIFEKFAFAEALIANGAIVKGRNIWESTLADPSRDTAQAHAALARALLKAGDSEHALPHLRRAYELDPQNVTYRTDYESHRQ